VKVAAALLFVASVALTPRRSLGVFAFAALLLLVGFVASGLRPIQLLRRFRVLAAFLPLVALLPFVAGGEQSHVAGLSLSGLGLWGAWSFLAKASLGLGVSVILTASTSIEDILAALAKLRAPKVLLAIAASMLRYLDVIVAETSRTRVAMASRGYAPNWFWQASPLAYSVGTLFVRSFERSERIHMAMLARGFDGTMPTPELQASPRHWVAVCWPAAALLAATSATLIF